MTSRWTGLRFSRSSRNRPEVQALLTFGGEWYHQMDALSRQLSAVKGTVITLSSAT